MHCLDDTIDHAQDVQILCILYGYNTEEMREGEQSKYYPTLSIWVEITIALSRNADEK